MKDTQLPTTLRTLTQEEVNTVSGGLHPLASLLLLIGLAIFPSKISPDPKK